MRVGQEEIGGVFGEALTVGQAEAGGDRDGLKRLMYREFHIEKSKEKMYTPY